MVSLRILFVYTNIDVRAGNFGEFPAMQLGIAYISALLKKYGHSCDLLLITSLDYLKEIENKINQLNTDIVAFTSVATQFPYVRHISEYIHDKFPKLFQICGGPHATLVPKEVLLSAKLNAVCVGEGEYPMLELVEKLSRNEDYYKIKNLFFRIENDKVIQNDIRPFNEDLDSLPFPDRSLYKNYIELDKYPHSVFTTRGCNFSCYYCCNHAFKKITTGKYVRSRQVDNIITEINELKRFYPKLDYLYIEDETIYQNHRFFKELLPKLKNTGLKFGANFRPGVIPPEYLEELRDAGFVRLNIGIESGNEWIRKNVLNRRYKNEDIIDIFQKAKKLGFFVKSYNLIGLPHETPQTFEDTIKINRIIRPNTYILNIFYPYPGTRLAQMCSELGLMNDTVPDNIRERTQSILKLPGFPEEEIMHYFNTWDDRINSSRYSWIIKNLKRIEWLKHHVSRIRRVSRTIND